MECILLSNVPHYHHLARALGRAGYLRRYITSVSLAGKAQAPSFLPSYWRKKLEGRRLNGIPASAVRQLWLPEALQRGLPALGLCSMERGNWVNNELFDWGARRWIEACDVLHFASSVGLYCARRGKRSGSILVCDLRQAHPNALERVLREEGLRFGLSPRIPGKSYEGRVLEELALADYVAVPSSYVRQTLLAGGFDGDKIFVNPYGVDVSMFSPGNSRGAGFQILYAGQITLGKGIQYLLQAVKELKLPGAKLRLVGSVDPVMAPILRSYEGVFEHIGPVPKAELARHYGESSVFVLPTLSDSFGLVVFEAMACGTPVIVSENTGAREQITEGREGFVVPIRDVEALKAKILYLYEHPEVREEMGRVARSRACEMTWDAYGARAVEFYRGLEGRHERARMHGAEMAADLPTRR